MSLAAKIDEDLKQAMRDKDQTKLSALRMLKSAVKYAALERPAGAVLNDAETLQVIQKQIKQRRESIEQFKGAGRNDLSTKEAAELDVLQTYLPKQLSDEALKKIVEQEVGSQGALTKKDFGRMMKHLNEKLAGSADNKRLSEILAQLLK